MITFAIEYQDAFKAATSKTLCPSTGVEETIECKTGPIGEPSNTEKELASVSWRWLSPKKSIGFSLQTTFDFKADVLAADLPIFLVRNKDKDLVGGLRFGWRDDTNDLDLGVFVGKALNLF